MRSLRWLLSFSFTSVVAIAAALYLASSVVGRIQAQPKKVLPPPAVPSQQGGPPPVQQQQEARKDAVPAGPDINSGVAPVQATADVPEVSEPDVKTRDPFRPYREFRPTQGSKEKGPSTDPLQNIDLNSAVVLAVLWDVPKPRALIQAGNATYTVMKDTKIGRNGGVVVGIREGEVVVAESYEDDGKIIRQYVSLKMAELKKKQAANP